MIEIKDEVLVGEPLYRFVDENGNIIFDNLRIEQVTPVIQEGTPVNKKLFARIEENNNLVKQYNVPKLDKLWDDYNYLSLDNEVVEYEVGMRVLIDLQHQYTEFTTSILPALVAGTGSEATAVKGFYATVFEPFDKNTSTYYVGRSPSIKIICPVPIKPTTVTYRAGMAVSGSKGTFNILGSDNPTSNVFGGTTLGSGELTSSVSTKTLTITDSNYYTVFPATTKTTSSSSAENINVYEMDITAGSVSMFNKALPSYININNLGNKMISGAMEAGKKYELIYDGTMFNAREVA